jgi:hypothetical protein
MQAVRQALVWLFCNRQTGRLTVLQWPNIPLAVYLLATVIHVGLASGSAASTVVAAVASAALAVWSVLEVACGVNPFRRGLGCVVLIFVIVSALRRGG